MKSARVLLSVLILLCCRPIQLYASRATFLITPADPSPISSEPGRVVTRAFFVSDTGSGEGVFDFDAEVPEGWQLLSGRETLEIDLADREMTLVSIYIPDNTPAGNYEITYKCKSSETGKELEYYIIGIEVLPRKDFSLELVESPPYCIAGDTYRLIYQLKNKGNVQSDFLIKGISQDQLNYSMDRRLISLKAGESSTVRVYVETDPLMTDSINHLFQLEVIPDHDEDWKTDMASLVHVMPRVTGKEEPYNTIPLELAIEPVFKHGETDTFGLMTEISGQGSLDEKGEKNIAYFLKRPFNNESQLTPEQEEYRLRFWTDNLDLLLGDAFYSLSTLTETSKFGRGLSGSIELDKFTLDSFYLTERDSAPLFEEIAASVRYTPSHNSNYSINFLNKKDVTVDNIFSVEGHLYPLPRDLFNFEYASSGGTISDDSYYFTLGGSHDKISYRLRYLHSGHDFPGTYQDLDRLNSNFTFKLNENLSISTIYGRTQYNIDREYPSLKEFLQTRMNWRINSETALQFYMNTLYHDDRLPFSENWFDRENMGMVFSRSIGQTKLNATVDYGTTDDYNNSTMLFVEKYGLSLNTALTDKQDLYTSLTFSRNENDGLNNLFHAADIKWSWDILPTTKMFINYKTVNYPSSYYSGSDGIIIGFNHSFKDKSSLSFNGRYGPPRSAQDKTAFTLNLEYRTTLDIPISKKENMERLEGYVKYQRTGEPLSNVILRIGSSVAVTDSYGRYVFHSLTPGDYKLYLDPSSLDKNLITAQNFPLQVSLEKEETNNLDIDIVESSTIRGHLNVYELKPGYALYSGGTPEYRDPVGLSDTLIEFRKDKERYRVITDKKGYFYMSRLRPGEWSIHIDESILPENHYFDEENIIVDLDIEEEKELEIKILSKVRPIIFIDEGVIEEQEPGNE